MLEQSPELFHLAVAGVGLLLYIFLWVVTRDLPAAARIFSRLALAILALAPIVLALFFGAEMKDAGAPPRIGTGERPVASAPDTGGSPPRPAVTAPKTSEPSPAPQPQPQPRMTEEAARPAQPAPSLPPPVVPSPPVAAQAPPPVASAEPPVAAPSPPLAGGTPSIAPAAEPPVAAAPSPPPPPAKPADEPTGGSGPSSVPVSPSTRGPSIGAARKAAPPRVDDRWDVVPVFYGTNRAPDAAVTVRAAYTAERANRLELGRALVTVPKIHETPNIERPWVYRIPGTQIVLYREAEDPAKYFTFQEVKRLSETDFLAFVRERLASSRQFANHALVFVHGFNTTFDYALFRTAQIAYDLKFDGAPFVFTWPSREASTPLDYAYDRESAEGARPHLRRFLELVARETGATSVSVIAHSMGNQVLLPVLEDLKREAPAGVKISEVILAAPDMERGTFENLATAIAGLGRGVTLYASSNDRALAASHRFWGGGVRAGEVPSQGPVVLGGLDTIDVSNTSTDWFSLNHSGYAEKTEIINDIQLLLQTGERPPKARVPILESVPVTGGEYWRYPKR